jgi:uncharacterized repeat protein (TIGR01451 family)
MFYSITRLGIPVLLILLSIFGFLHAPASAAPRSQAENLTIDKQIIEAEATSSPGETIQFELTVTNFGEAPVGNLTIIDRFDVAALSISEIQVNTGEEWVDSSPLQDAGELTWVNVQLEPNQVWQARYQAIVSDPLLIANPLGSDLTSLRKEISNKATLRVDDREIASKTFLLTIPLPGDALQVQKSALEPSIGLDGLVRFTLLVVNESEGFVFSNLMIADNFKGESAVPDITSVVVLDSSNVQGAPAYENRGDQIIWSLDPLGPGDSWIVEYESIIEPFFEAGNKQISNSATLLVTTEENNLQIHESGPLELNVKIPQLTLSRETTGKNGEEEFRPGDTVIFDIQYNNVGTDAATGVILQDNFDEKVFAAEPTIQDNGERNGSAVVWDLGVIEAGESGKVRYEATIKSDLLTNEQSAANPNIEVINQAVISAENLESPYLDSPVTFIVRTPILKINQYKMDDLNGGKINPGDTLRFTIEFENQGTVPASAVSVQAEFDQSSLSIADISERGNPDESKIVWQFEELLAGGTKLVSYVMLVNEVNVARNALNNAALSGAGIKADQSSLQINIEPAVVPTPVPANAEAVPFEQKNFEFMALLIGGLVLGSLAIVGYQTHNILRKPDFEQKHLRDTVEMFTILVIVSAVLILAMVSDIGPTPAVGVLSGIAGYVLGRSSGTK